MALGALQTEGDLLAFLEQQLPDHGALIRQLQGRVSQGVHGVVLTADLPAAAAANDGRVVVEDAGAGDRNLVFYAGGQRFRVDGGVAF